MLADDTPIARDCHAAISENLNQVPIAQAGVIVVIGGDGFMLAAMHRFHNQPVQLYGINAGKVGFLLNPACQDGSALNAKIAAAEVMTLTPLFYQATNTRGGEQDGIGFNEITILRETRQALNLSIEVDEVTRLLEFVGDGIVLATPAGSTAQNMSIGGPVLPLDANLLSLAAMGSFRPRRWPGALIHRTSTVTIKVHNPTKRPASMSADSAEFRDIAKIKIRESDRHSVDLLFDPDLTLGERIIKEQFIND